MSRSPMGPLATAVAQVGLELEVAYCVGGVISPLLANVYLHEVVDKWFEDTVKPLMGGQAFLVRYADDLVLAFSSERDACRVLAVLPKRFAKYGLTLHPEKTRLVPFRRPSPRRRTIASAGGDQLGSFDLLGFTHYWARSRKGYWVIKQKTAASRLTRALKTVRAWCRDHRHLPIAEQHRVLVRKLQGHNNYYGLTGNSRALGRFHREVTRAWRMWLSRRSQRGGMPWDRFQRLLVRFTLPPATPVHSVYCRAANP